MGSKHRRRGPPPSERVDASEPAPEPDATAAAEATPTSDVVVRTSDAKPISETKPATADVKTTLASATPTTGDDVPDLAVLVRDSTRKTQSQRPPADEAPGFAVLVQRSPSAPRPPPPRPRERPAPPRPELASAPEPPSLAPRPTPPVEAALKPVTLASLVPEEQAVSVAAVAIESPPEEMS